MSLRLYTGKRYRNREGRRDRGGRERGREGGREVGRGGGPEEGGREEGMEGERKYKGVKVRRRRKVASASYDLKDKSKKNTKLVTCEMSSTLQFQELKD